MSLLGRENEGFFLIEIELGIKKKESLYMLTLVIWSIQWIILLGLKLDVWVVVIEFWEEISMFVKLFFNLLWFEFLAL